MPSNPDNNSQRDRRLRERKAAMGAKTNGLTKQPPTHKTTKMELQQSPLKRKPHSVGCSCLEGETISKVDRSRSRVLLSNVKRGQSLSHAQGHASNDQTHDHKQLKRGLYTSRPFSSRWKIFGIFLFGLATLLHRGVNAQSGKKTRRVATAVPPGAEARIGCLLPEDKSVRSKNPFFPTGI